MKHKLQIRITTSVVTMCLSLSVPALVGAAVVADGIACPSPLGDRSCIALRVDVPDGQALAGIQWYNGSSEDVFAKVLVAAGDGDLPPAYEEAVVVAEDVTGLEDGWSSVDFSEPIASLSGVYF